MTIKDALREGYSILFYAEVETPMLDATVLLAEALSVSKEKLFASLPDEIDSVSYARFKEYVDKRCRGIPVSYIRRKKEFYGLEFYVDERVLVPRPDTEVLVEEVLSLLGNNTFRAKTCPKRNPKILDLCTGSGCVAIAVKFNARDVDVYASDITREVKDVFELNMIKILGGKKIPFFISDVFENISGKYDIITCNPPYLTDAEVENLGKLGWVEPVVALAGGRDGTEIAVRVIEEAPDYLEEGGYLMLEAAPSQMTKLWAIMSARGFRDIYTRKDLGKRERIICGRYYGKKDS